MTIEKHWAYDLIRKPWEKGACGPDSFDCWGLVRWSFEHVHGIAMPAIAVGESGINAAAILEASAVSGWRPAGSVAPAEHDVVLMQGLEGPHVGVMVYANGRLLLLHCLDGVGVCAQPIGDLPRLGFTGFVYWRRAS